MPRVTASEVLPAQPGQVRTDSGLGPPFDSARRGGPAAG
jgi:hypothetical protein